MLAFCFSSTALVGSRGRQSQELLDEIVHHELGGNDQSNVDQSCLGAAIEFGDTASLVDATDHDAELSGRAAAGGFGFGVRSRLGLLLLLVVARVVGFGQDHVPGLAAQTGGNAGANSTQQRDDPFELVPLELVGQNGGGGGRGRDRIEELGHQVKAHLLSKGVRDLLGQHGPDARHGDPNSIVADDPGQAGQYRVVLVGNIGDLLDPEGFHWHQEDRGDGSGQKTRQHKGNDLVRFAQEGLKDGFGEFVDAEFHGALNAVSKDGGSQTVEEGTGTLVGVAADLDGCADQSLALVFL